MEIKKFNQFIDQLYEDRDKYNIDAWHVRGYFSSMTGVSPAEVEDAFLSYAKRSAARRKILDDIVTLQKKYRTLFGWDENINNMIGALSYLGQKSNKFADYLFERITSKPEEERYSISEKYFLTFCLTKAARVDLHAAGLLWRLHWCSWATNWIWDSRSVDEDEIEEEFIQLDRNVHEGLRDSMKVFDTAASEVICFLISKLNNNYYGTPPMVWALLKQVLGETASVRCLLLDQEGDYSYSTEDFTDQVLTLLRNPRNLSNIENLFSIWCKNDERFRFETLKVINSPELEIDYLTQFLIMKLRKVSRTIKDELALMSQEEKQENDPHDLSDWQERSKHLEDDQKFKGLLEQWIGRLKDASTRQEEYVFWQRAMHKTRLDRLTLSGEAYDYINFHKHTFRQRIMRGI